MPLLKYKPEFVHLVRMGLLDIAAEKKGLTEEKLGLVGHKVKRFTIRKYRKDGHDPKAGDTLYHYETDGHVCGPKIGESTCLYTVALEINEDSFKIFDRPGIEPFIEAMGDGDWMENLAKLDGFENWSALASWFKTTHGKLPFKGLGIAW